MSVELTPDQLRALVQELDVDVPIVSMKEKDGVLTLRTAWETFEVPFPVEGRTNTLPRPSAGLQELDDLTDIPGIGSKRAEALHYDHGFTTFEELLEAIYDGSLDEVLPGHVLADARAWLEEHI